MIALVYLLVGLLVGFAVAWFARASQIQKAKAEAEQSKSQLEKDLASAQSAWKSEEQQSAKYYQRLEESQKENTSLVAQLARSRNEIENYEKKLREQEGNLKQLQEQFRLEFNHLANKIFEEKSQKFTDQNKANLGELLNPLKERMQSFQEKVEQSHLAREKSTAALREQLVNLQQLNQQITHEAKSLTLALRGDTKTQGNWGEMQLERILQMSGLEKDTHYRKEQNFKNEEGANQRLDYIIDLPDGKNLIIDSKVSLTAYMRFCESEDEAEKASYKKAHVTSIYNHMKGLSAKNYQSLYGIEAPDYVLMFIANEPALALALQEDPQLYEQALRQNLVLVSPTTLMATMRTISYIWRQDAQNKNAEEIARQAGDMYDKFVGFAEDLLKLGDQMKTTQGTYQNAMKKLSEGRGNLVRRSEKLRELGAETKKQIDQRLIDRSIEDE